MSASRFLRWIPGWLGFLLLIATGALLIIIGAGRKPLVGGFFVVGGFAIAIGLFSWIVGGVSRVKGRVGELGVLVEIGDLPWWGWLIDAALTAAAFVILFAL